MRQVLYIDVIERHLNMLGRALNYLLNLLRLFWSDELVVQSPRLLVRNLLPANYIRWIIQGRRITPQLCLIEIGKKRTVEFVDFKNASIMHDC